MLTALVIIQLLENHVTPGDRFAWSMQGPGLVLIQSYRYEVEVDGYRLTDPLRDVTCALSVPVPFVECTAPIPVSFGPHALRVRSVDATMPGSPSIEGEWSPLFSYVMRPTPPMPERMRVVPPAPAQLRPVKKP